jgi:uncharacterized protein YlzI (FlbEa/FlbD family)
MIKLMNMAEGHIGDPLFINPDHIITVFPQVIDGGSIRTIIYGGTNQTTWVVEEGVEEVIKKINEYKKSM